MNNFLGVIGGMGPLATADFLKKLAENTPARTDQEHIPVMLYGDCTTPDRTSSTTRHDVSPLPCLLDGIRHLQQAGARAICIPCNSAHGWYDELAAECHVPLFHIVRASADQVRRKNPDARTVGVLSTLGTHQAGIYTRTLQDMGFNVASPTEYEFESLISPGIACIKANRLTEVEQALEAAAGALRARGADIIILGCTEIPLGMQNHIRQHPALFVDSSEALALTVVEFFTRA